MAVEPIEAMAAEREPSRATYVRGVAEALPLRSAAVDVALMSMVFHQLRDRAAAMAELARVVRSGGVALLRTPTQETGADFEWVRFFPEVRTCNAGRMPAESEAVEALAAAGFACDERRIVRQCIAESLAAYVERIRRRPFSSLRAMPDDVFARRFAEFERHCRSVPDRPIVEPVHLFVFRKL